MAHDILVNFEISLAVVIPKTPRNRAISYTNYHLCKNIIRLAFRKQGFHVGRGFSLSHAPFILRKVVSGKKVTLPAESTLASVYMRKRLTPLPESRAGRACSDRLALTQLTWLGEQKCLYGEKLARREG